MSRRTRPKPKTRRTPALAAAQQAAGARTVARNYGRTATITATEWRETLTFFAHRCAYCGIGGEALLELEHFIPVERGGASVRANCVPACRSCNRRKMTADPRRATFWATIDVACRARLTEFFRTYGHPTQEPFLPKHFTRVSSAGGACGETSEDHDYTTTARLVTCDACAETLPPTTHRKPRVTSYCYIVCDHCGPERIELGAHQIAALVAFRTILCPCGNLHARVVKEL